MVRKVLPTQLYFCITHSLQIYVHIDGHGYYMQKA